MYNLILASASPRRSEIMKQVNMEFKVLPSKAKEIITKTKPEDVVMELSHIKALDILETIDDKDSIVIGADTVVAHDGNILGKPESKTKAYEMINSIQGDIHSVYTGVSIMLKIIEKDVSDRENIDERIVKIEDEFKILRKNGYIYIESNFFVKTDVKVRKMTDEQIKNYIDTKEPYDKAGGYAIQGAFAINILEIQGDYYNVVGLPIAKLNDKLEKIKNTTFTL